MPDTLIKQFDEIVHLQKEANHKLTTYWQENAIYASFEFWVMFGFLLIPLLILFFKIDKTKIFLIGFFGYSFHVVFGYTDQFGRNMGFWNYPYPLVPAIPGLAIDSSLVPVIFMLIYQWSVNKEKNYYLFATLAAALFCFLFKPLLVSLGLFKLYGNSTYLHLFLTLTGVIIVAKFMTDVFIWTQKKYANHTKRNIKTT